MIPRGVGKVALNHGAHGIQVDAPAAPVWENRIRWSLLIVGGQVQHGQVRKGQQYACRRKRARDIVGLQHNAGDADRSGVAKSAPSTAAAIILARNGAIGELAKGARVQTRVAANKPVRAVHRVVKLLPG